MTMTTLDRTVFESVAEDVERAARRQRWWFWGVLGVVLAYLAFSYVQFDIANLRKNWRPDRAAL
ncbi:MAG: phosphonate ABC transporter, permease protein PhnE, partial [Pseudomonadota bacterium]